MNERLTSPRPPAAEINAASGNRPMKDMQAHLEKLRADAAECRRISVLATDPEKRELFTKLANHLSVLASEIELAIASKVAGGESGGLSPGVEN